MKKSIKLTLMGVVTFIVTLLILCGLLILSAKVPNSKIQNNLEKSALNFADIDAFEKTYKSYMAYWQDNYADAILLDIIWNVKDNDPVKSTIDTKYYDGDDMGEAYGLYVNVLGQEKANQDYTRYWHGSMIVIRPLLTFTDVNGVRNIGFVAIVILLVILCGILVLKKQYFAAGALALSLIMIQFWTVRLSMEYQPMFILCMIMSVLFIIFEKKGDDTLIILGIISATATAFFDFLTAETLGILVPLMLVFIIREQDKRNHEFKKNLILIVKVMVTWGIAYVMTFITKWTIASLMNNKNEFKAAMSSVGERVNGDVGNMSKLEILFSAIPANLSTMFNGSKRVDWGMIILGLLALLIVFGSIYYLFRKKGTGKDFVLTVLVLGIIPYVRYMVLSNHSYLHEFFTYRAQVVSLMALMAIIWFNTIFSGKEKR